MSDSEQCSNRLELDLISLLVNFSCELGQIMTRYDFLWARWVILSNVWNWPKLDLIFDLGKLCMCIGVNRWIFWKKSQCDANQIQNFIEIRSSRFRWYSFVFARTQSRLVLFYTTNHNSLCKTSPGGDAPDSPHLLYTLDHAFLSTINTMSSQITGYFNLGIYLKTTECIHQMPFYHMTVF